MAELNVHCQLDLHIVQGKTRQIRFTLPASLGNKIQVVPVDSPVRVIEQELVPATDNEDAGEQLLLVEDCLGPARHQGSDPCCRF